jgi:glycosyltransferase involved in cell wall biosynthesis
VTGTVLHISASDAGGGAARSAYRIHSGLRSLGWDSRMLVGERRTAAPEVRPLKRNLAWRVADRVCGTVAERLDLQYVLYPSSFGVARDPWFRGADVVQLYNVHGSYFSHTALPLLSRRRPLVWRLSDMWALTGHVIYSYECERWRHGCGSCPYLREYPSLRRDTTALLFRWKDAVYRHSRITVVAPSRWLQRVARESPLLGRFPVRRIANGIDLETFRPQPREEARRALGLDPGRPTVLWSALDLRDRRKGGREALAALRLLERDVQLVVAGGGPAPDGVRSLGVLGDERLALAYSAADVFLLPSLAENLPNAALEAIACGTPVAAFDVGGIGDAVRDGRTGSLVEAGDVGALASAVASLLDADLRESCRKVAEAEFSADREARDFAALYEELISGVGSTEPPRSGGAGSAGS